MKQIKILGVLAIALTLGLSACGGKPSSGEGEHVHTFDTTVWESNATEHWHPATCEHTKEKGDKAKHTFGEPYDIVAPTCTEAGSQKVKCTVCEYVKTETLKATGHSAQPAEGSADWTVVTEPTCTEVGSKTYVCANCHEAIPVEIPALGHNFKKDAEGNEIIEWTTAPNCTDAGVDGHRTCERCGQEVAVSSSEAAALGHNFKKDANGNDEITWSVEPTCEKAGVGTKHCERCGQDVAVSEDEAKPLGHDLEAVGGETTPTDGTAAVRLYHCKRCDQTYMGFLANEVTNDSKEHVAFEPETVAEGEEQGARFLGRPIGNALALDKTGTSVNKSNGECVYSSAETGDFIEYAFNLNATQAATLASCRMYVDAKPADYLNGTDFWAYGASNDEWTPGFYIDGGDERFEKNEDGTFKMVQDHEKSVKQEDGSYAEGVAKVDADGNPVMVKQGKRIEDYRYVLYVDGQVKDFDPTTENPTHGSNTNMQREEFVLPYTFSLHEGLNKIKFVMAGGYRSLFYKCIFRPYVEPTPITVNATELSVEIGKTVAIESSMTGLTYTSSSNSTCTVDANGVVTGLKVGTATITVSKEGNYKPAKVKINVTEIAGTFQISAETGAILPEAAEGVTAGAEWYVSGYNPSASRLRNFQKDSTVTFTFTSQLAGKFDIIFNARGSNVNLADHISVKVNNADVAVSGSYNSANSGVDTKIGQADLVTGENANTLVITTISENSPMQLHYIKFVPVSGEGGQGSETPVEPATPTWPAECPDLIDTSAWAAGASGTNKAGKTYTQISGAGKVGVKIAWADVSDGAYDGTKLPSSAGSGVKYQVKAPKAGIYEMIMKAKVSGSSGTSNNFSSRGLTVTVNTWASQSNIYGSRVYGDAGLSTSEKKQFVVALVYLTGEEDTIYIEQPFYRFDFDNSSEVIFAEL